MGFTGPTAASSSETRMGMWSTCWASLSAACPRPDRSVRAPIADRSPIRLGHIRTWSATHPRQLDLLRVPWVQWDRVYRCCVQQVLGHSQAIRSPSRSSLRAKPGCPQMIGAAPPHKPQCSSCRRRHLAAAQGQAQVGWGPRDSVGCLVISPQSMQNWARGKAMVGQVATTRVIASRSAAVTQRSHLPFTAICLAT